MRDRSSQQYGIDAGDPVSAVDAQAALAEYWKILVRRRRVVATCLISVVAVASVLTLMATPEYRATTTLQIERHGPDILAFKDVLNTDPSGYSDFYVTQYRLLESRAVLAIAAERIDLIHRPEFAAPNRSPLGRIKSRVRSIFTSGDRATPTDANRLDEAVWFISQRLSIEPVRNSYLVRVSVSDRSPELTADLADAVAEAYQQFSLDARYSTTAQASEFLTKQVAQLQREIKDKQKELKEYSSEKGILSVRADTQDIASQALAGLNQRYVDARGRMARAEAQFNAVANAAPDALPEVMNSPLISKLRQEHAVIERRYRQMTERFHTGWPALQQAGQEQGQSLTRLEEETQNIAAQVRSVAEADFRRARDEVRSFEQQMAEQKQEVRRNNLDSLQYASLQEELKAMRLFRDELVNRQSQTEVSDRLRDTRASNIRLVDRAKVPEESVKPRKLLNLVLSTLVGLMLGLGAALLVDHLDNTVKNEQELKSLTGLPLLAQVPLWRPLRAVSAAEGRGSVDESVDLVSHTDPQSAFAEAFRILRTSILLASPEHPPREIVVTSSEPGDGKSTVSVNLAVVLTQLGRRVLLVDADLRRPTIHEILNVHNDVGLSNYLTGNASFDAAVREYDVPNLTLMTSGPIPPTPSELLGSSKLEELIGMTGEQGRFDHIVFDSPPVVAVSDSIILASRVDSTVLTVRSGQTSREVLAQCVKRLQQSRASVVGTVMNGVAEQVDYYYSGRNRRGAPDVSRRSAGGILGIARRQGRRTGQA